MESKLDQADRAILEPPMATILLLPKRRLREWYRCTVPFVQATMQRAKQRTKIGNHCISHFSHPKLRDRHGDQLEQNEIYDTRIPRNDDSPP